MQVDKENAISVEDLSTIYITGGGFVRRPFKGIGVASAMGWNEVGWATSLTRSNTFAFENIDDVDIGQIAQCQIVFPYMNIADFIDLQRVLKERYVMVDYFNVDLGKRITQEMAVTGNERKNLYAMGNKVFGMQNTTVKFVATNRDNEYLNLTVSYNLNGGVGTIDNIECSYSAQVRLSNGAGLTNGNKHIKEWNTKTDGSGWAYGLNQSITLWQSMTLYAIWE